MLKYIKYFVISVHLHLIKLQINYNILESSFIKNEDKMNFFITNNRIMHRKRDEDDTSRNNYNLEN